MGVGIIGVSSGAAEALPFGATTLITSGFVNGLAHDYVANVAPGRYIIEGSTIEGNSPVIAYAPNSNTTAIAYPGKSAILHVTQAETVIKLSALPLVGMPTLSGTWHSNGSSYYKSVSAAQNTNGSIIVMGLNYYTGGSYVNEIWRSVDFGVTWTNTFYNNSNYQDPKPIEFFPGDNGYFLMGFNGAIYRSTDGSSWSTSQNVGTVYDFEDLGNNVVLCGGSNGIYRSTNHGQSWNAIYTSNECMSLAKIEGVPGTVIGVGSNAILYSSNSGQSWTRNSLTYQNTQNLFHYFYNGLAALKNHVVSANNVYPSGDVTGSSFTTIDSLGRPVVTSWTGELADRTNANRSGPELQWVVKNSENRGFILAIGQWSGNLLMSTDGQAWQKVGNVNGPLPNNNGGIYTGDQPHLKGNVMFVPSGMTGLAPRYSNKFAYKIFASAI